MRRTLLGTASAPLGRRRLLALGAAGAASALMGAPAARADSAADAEADHACMRLLATASLVELAWIGRALEKEEILRGPERRLLRTLRASEQDHYATLVAAIADQAPPTADDYEPFQFRPNDFGSPRRIWARGLALHELLIGTAIGALHDLTRPDLRRLVGQIVAVEGTHEAAVRRAAGVVTPQRILPAALTMEQATAAIDPYLGG
jgi:hypothetical protein